ncbi:DUF3558 domain-containing protein [Nocardiopsis sp. NPDC007018]|uniref:DUF3558 domain-containing protein n=1 Tax=Nocardiopsis sp. NPDC007018 TaxID=3155721 RepID=UPI0034069D17
MSENGPYNQPPQNPYGGDGTGGQPPYGQPQGAPYGDAATGGQPGYGQGPYPGAPGQDQGMYAGGQPPYGPGPGGPGGPPGYPPVPPPQQGGGGSKAGLWVVMGGGVVIVILVIAVVVMLVTNGSGDGGEEIAAGPDETSEAPEAEPVEEEPAEEEPVAGGALGDPPHALPTEPCESFTEQIQTDFDLRDSGRKYVSDNSSSCSGLGELPDNNSGDGFGSLEIAYKLPYSASDSPEAASEDLNYTLERIRGEHDSDRYEADDVEVDEELDLGSESYLLVTRSERLGDRLPEATVLLRQDNVVITVTYYLDTTRGGREDLELSDDVQEIMLNAGNEALAALAG